MRKAVFFVEGLTELIFVRQLLLSLTGSSPINIRTVRAWGGGQSGPRIQKFYAEVGPQGSQRHALLVDCQGDSRVISDILDNHRTMMARGYRLFVGIRDLFPDFLRSDLSRLRSATKNAIERELGSQSNVHVIFGVMEAEAWFLSEFLHLPAIHPNIHEPRVRSTFNVDLVEGDIEGIRNPANLLHQIYQLEGLHYSKTSNSIQRTVDALNFNHLVTERCHRQFDLQKLVSLTRDFLS